VRRRLSEAEDVLDGKAEADEIFEQRVGLKPAQRIMHARGEIGRHVAEAVETVVSRREAGQPLAYALGTAFFCGNSFVVTPAVLIPRPETEWLVQRGEDWLKERRFSRKKADRQLTMLDLGCASG
jgi:release factor glutamine methyltransferase